MSSGIYVIRNLKNGKIYIGQAQDFRVRWRKHKALLKRGKHDNRHLQSSWNKYGEKSFQFQKLEYCSIERLDEREQHYLDLYISKGICYNLATDAKAPNRGRIATEETRRKISEASKNMSPETRRKISDAGKGRKPTEETRRKLSEANRNRPPISEETRRKMSEARKNISEETRRKISEANKNRPPISEETRRKMSKGQKVRQQKERLAKEQQNETLS